MKLRASLAAVVALVLIVVVAPEATGKGGTLITSCGQTVTTNAVLTTDLVCSGSGIIVGASGITIDLGGHVLRGDNSGTDFGIADPAPAFGSIAVKNGVVRGFLVGVYVNGADHVSVSNVIASGNTNEGFTIAGDGTKIQSSTGSGNGSDGINVFGTSVTIKSSTVAGNGHYGISVLGDSATVQSSTAAANAVNGINVNGDAAVLKSNRAIANGFSGGGASDLTGLGINVINFTTVPTGRNTALGNDDPTKCQPALIC